jgi:hypothetical protein
MADEMPQDRVARMDVPPTGGCCGALFVPVFVGGFVALAVDNLAHFSQTHWGAIVASVLWLALVVFVLVVGVHAAGGVWASVVGFLGLWASRHFVESARDGDRTVISFGYWLFGHRFYYLRVEREQVLSVTVNTGQATALAGKDMNDWSVALWYRTLNRPPGVPAVRFLDDEIHLVGPGCAKEVAAEFFRAFVEFLRAAGVPLEPTEKENEFRVAEAAPPVTPASDPPS